MLSGYFSKKISLVESKQVPSLLAVLLFTNRCGIKLPKDIRKKLLKYFAKVYIYDYTFKHGIHEYKVDGKLHREDGPALITDDGYQSWYKNGKWHRADGPACIWPDGTQQWCRNGKLHRENDPAHIGADGKQYWYKNGKCHREDGPAIIYASGAQSWWINDKLHRVGFSCTKTP